MKRGTLVAVAILVVLLGVYFLTGTETPQRERSPMTIQKVDGLQKIVLEPPSGSKKGSNGDAGSGGEAAPTGDAPAEIVFEKREDGWWVAEPVESPVSSETATTIDEAFGSSVETDDLPISASSANKKKYELQSDTRARIKLFAEGDDAPSVDLYVGSQLTVAQTDAERTFVQKPEGGRIYRAAMAIGEFVRQSVSDFRSKQITELDQDDLTRVEWRYEDGLTLVLEKKDDSWELVRPQVDWELDDSAIDRTLGSLTTMTADGFADDEELSAVGLEPPTARIEVTARVGGGDGGGTGGPDASGSTGSSASKKEKNVELLLGKVEADEGAPSYYVKVASKPFKYEIAKFDGEHLLARLGDLRSKEPRTFDKESITEVQFPGEAGVVVRKEEGSWSLVRPEMEKSLNQSKLDSKLVSVASLTVNGFPDVSASEAGLGAGADELRFATKEGEHTILFGEKVDEESGDRYVKFGDGDEIFTVTKFTADKLHPKGEDLVGKSKKPKMKMPGGHKGLKGMGGMRKKRILRKLKQKMGR